MAMEEAETGGHQPRTPGASAAGGARKEPRLEPLEGV